MCIAFGAGLLQRLLCMLLGITTLRKGCGTPSSLGHGRILFYGSLQGWLRWNMQNRGSIEWTDSEWPVLFAIVCWRLWKSRNKLVFCNSSSSIEELVASTVEWARSMANMTEKAVYVDFSVGTSSSGDTVTGYVGVSLKRRLTVQIARASVEAARLPGVPVPGLALLQDCLTSRTLKYPAIKCPITGMSGRLARATLGDQVTAKAMVRNCVCTMWSYLGPTVLCVFDLLDFPSLRYTSALVRLVLVNVSCPRSHSFLLRRELTCRLTSRTRAVDPVDQQTFAWFDAQTGAFWNKTNRTRFFSKC
ncbi:hypothetical protein GOBAR_DD20880 [Gossypium barbadense]|nr:hypothetical protein GOBAR_DD20880 [Gossypium barbadense]